MPRAKVPQANAFAVSKRNALNKLDKSPKGSLDAPIAAFIYRLNSHTDFVTTSCCSGRIVLFHEFSGRGGRWLLASHNTVTVDQVTNALASGPSDGEHRGIDGGLAIAAGTSLESNQHAAGADGSGHISGGGAGNVALKMEPGILHVQCRDVSAAKWLLQVALRAGFRESGLVLSDSSKVMLAVRTTSNCLELPVAASDDTGVMRMLVPHEYLALVVEQANAKFEANAARLDRLQDCFDEACRAAADADVCVPCNDGSGEVKAGGNDSIPRVLPTKARGHHYWQVSLKIGLVPQARR